MGPCGPSALEAVGRDKRPSRGPSRTLARAVEGIMITVNIHEAKTQLSRLVDQAAKGEAFVIAKAGKPLVKVTALDAPATPRRLGFLVGEIAVPDDFDRMGDATIEALFAGDA